MSYGKRFGYKQDPHTCLWCGDRLKFTRVWEEPGGNMRPQVVAALADRDRIAKEVEQDSEHWITKKTGPFKHPDLGWINGGVTYPQVYNGTVTVGPRGHERPQTAGKPGHVDGDDHFCSGQCAQEFGRRAGELGYRLELNTPEASK